MAERAKGSRGCLFYSLVGVGLALVVVGVATFLGMRAAKKMIGEYTDAAPKPLPEVSLTPAEMQALQDRLNDFQQAVRQGRAEQPLRLSSDEVNALISTSPAGEAFRGRVHVQLEGSTPRAQLSLPLDELGLPVFKGRYFNGTATFEISLHDGFLRVSPTDLNANGRRLPGIYLDKIRKLNLAEKVNADPRASLALENIRSVEVKDGQLVVQPGKPQHGRAWTAGRGAGE